MFLIHLPISVFRDDITNGSFASGYVDPKSGEGIEEDFLELLNGKVLLMKDLSAQFSRRSEKVKEFLGSITNIYDQSFKKQTGTRGLVGSDECAFSWISGITNLALDGHHRYIAALGPRFFTFRTPVLTKGQEDAAFEIIDSPGLKEKKKQMAWTCSSYVHKLMSCSDKRFQINKINSESKKHLRCLAKLQSKLRGYCSKEANQYE